ncbi:unnamed protein product [Arctogadus glacialis]
MIRTAGQSQRPSQAHSQRPSQARSQARSQDRSEARSQARRRGPKTRPEDAARRRGGRRCDAVNISAVTE